MPGEIAVRCTGIKKSYRVGAAAVPALRGLDLEVRDGEFMMLVGPSGCGKTTLLSIIAGILSQDEGDCHAFDRDWRSFSGTDKSAFRARNIGFVFQQFNLIPSLSLASNTAVPLLIGGVPRREALKKGVAALEQVGLGERAGSRPSELSGGQQQRVAIARALIHEPKLVVCDEPTSALDHVTGQHVLELLRGIAHEQRRTLIVVTHDSRIFRFADRIAVMDDGRIERIVNSPEGLGLSELEEGRKH